ncbi:hypothetical protein [Bacillus sp. JCM 19041]|uniref:hypothetical protein n=1 Tax=Bacillus sp. JCM 19041 TaxID=1460637 RepID=UPI0006D10C61
MDKEYERAREAQLCLEGYISKKTKLERATETDWVFKCEQSCLYTIRRSDGAMFYKSKLKCLFALGAKDKAEEELLLRLLLRYPAGVQVMSEDDESYYVQITEERRQGRKESTDFRVAKGSGLMYAKKRRLWSRKPSVAS